MTFHAEQEAHAVGSVQHPAHASSSVNTTRDITPSLQVVGQAKLDLANNMFNDEYEGCTEEMEGKSPQLLKEELEANQYLKTEREKAEQRWKQIKNNKLLKQFNDFRRTAIVAYPGNVATEFNRAVREFHQNPHNFQFKAFHYYLTRALQLLNSGKCYTVYRGCKTTFYYSGRGNVPFGQFTSSSLSNSIAISLPFFNGTLFVIRTCLGVNITAFSYYPNENEVLIPGYEVYQKVIVETDNKFWLEDPKRSKSNFNCFYYSSTKNPSEQDSNFNSSGKSGSVFEIGEMEPS
ncbi:LOW QUALITY PROTEIN: T-cell ecto-ADP-ribosyltransferase 1-like [Trichechus inunguis]